MKFATEDYLRYTGKGGFARFKKEAKRFFKENSIKAGNDIIKKMYSELQSTSTPEDFSFEKSYKMNTLKYEKMNSAEYLFQYTFWLCEYLESEGWKVKCKSGVEIWLEKDGYEFKLSGYDNRKYIQLRYADSWETIFDFVVDHGTSTAGILFTLEYYMSMDKLETKLYHIQNRLGDRVENHCMIRVEV